MTGTSSTGTVPPWTSAVGAMLPVQLGSALSVPLIAEVGAAGTARRLVPGGGAKAAALRAPVCLELK